MTRSAQASWSSKTSSSGLSWSTALSSARSAAIASRSSAKRPSATARPSTTATTPSTVRRERIAGQSNALTSGFGKASPDVSMMMWSGRFSCASNASIAGAKSSATVQHRQPLASSTMFSSGQLSTPQARKISPSTPTSPNSLITSARRRSRVVSSKWRISVVLPAPRNPVTMVAGIFVLISSPLTHCGPGTRARERRQARRRAPM